MKRNWVAGELLDAELEMVPTNASGGGVASVDGLILLRYGSAAEFANSGGSSSSNNNTNNNVYSSLFNMLLCPNGACLNDSNKPGDYALDPSDHLFDTKMACYKEWFLDVQL